MDNLKSNAPWCRDVNVVVTESLDRVHEDVFWAVERAVSDDAYVAVAVDVNLGAEGVVDLAVWGAVDRAVAYAGWHGPKHPALQDFLFPCGAGAD